MYIKMENKMIKNVFEKRSRKSLEKVYKMKLEYLKIFLNNADVIQKLKYVLT